MDKENLFVYHNMVNEKSLLYDKYSSKKYIIPSTVAKRIEEGNISKYDEENINKILSREPVKDKEGKKLKQLRLLLTNKCNFKCIYCYANGGNYNLGQTADMSIETAKKIIEYFYGKYQEIKQISFFGGEPLLGKKTIEFVCEYVTKLFKENKIAKMPMFSMVSNGYCIDEEVLKIIEKYNIKMIVSIDGPRKIQNLQRPLINGEETYDKVCNNLFRLRKLDSFSIEATYTKLGEENGLTRYDIRDYLSKKFNVSRVIVNSAASYHINTKEDTDENKYSPKEKLNYVQYFNKFFSNYPYIFDDFIIRLINVYRTSHYIENFCDAGVSQFTVLMTGDIYPCQIFLGEESKRLGNVFQDDEVKSMDGLCKSKNEIKCKKCGDKRFCQMCLKNNVEKLHCDNFKQGLEVFYSNMSDLYLNNRERYDELMHAYNIYGKSLRKDYDDDKVLELDYNKLLELQALYRGKSTEIISLYETEDVSGKQVLSSKIEIPDGAYITTPDNVSIDSRFLISSVLGCKEKNKGIAIVHNHGRGHLPSPKDSSSESKIVMLGKKVGIKYMHFIIYDMKAKTAGIRTHYIDNEEASVYETESRLNG
ncbi:radical SAM/SPASM domain-containing protein [Clostridium hydrogenum]|uniref:radical SAM/SPASM domain-containing protein n=1 Tax=Clostridium hydrogenum TaxID=2855764 RepID=UPI001F188854|nr:radical SAM protein [Clostridium hydrogenum]